MTTIEEMNKVIAVFDGWEPAGNRFEKTERYGDDLQNERCASIKATQFRYHDNWSLLMPICKKAIFYLHVDDTGHNLQMAIIHALAQVDVSDVHSAVYQFIIWYNNKANKPDEHTPRRPPA